MGSRPARCGTSVGVEDEDVDEARAVAGANTGAADVDAGADVGAGAGACAVGAGAGAGATVSTEVRNDALLVLNGGTDSGTNSFPLSPISRTTPSTRRSKAASSSFSASHIGYHILVPMIKPTTSTSH